MGKVEIMSLISHMKKYMVGSPSQKDDSNTLKNIRGNLRLLDYTHVRALLVPTTSPLHKILKTYLGNRRVVKMEKKLSDKILKKYAQNSTPFSYIEFKNILKCIENIDRELKRADIYIEYVKIQAGGNSPLVIQLYDFHKREIATLVLAQLTENY